MTNLIVQIIILSAKLALKKLIKQIFKNMIKIVKNAKIMKKYHT